MRDQTILGHLDETKDAVAHDMGYLRMMNALIRARIDAIETVLFGSRFGWLRVVFLATFAPKKLRGWVDNEHQKQLDEYNKQRAEAAVVAMEKRQREQTKRHLGIR